MKRGKPLTRSSWMKRSEIWQRTQASLRAAFANAEAEAREFEHALDLPAGSMSPRARAAAAVVVEREHRSMTADEQVSRYNSLVLKYSLPVVVVEDWAGDE